MTPGTVQKLRGVADKMATELVFTEAGTDQGLLPLNSLLGDFEALLRAEPGLAPSVEAAALQIRRCLDSVLESTGQFDGATLTWLGEWVSSCQALLDSIERGEDATPSVPDWSPGVLTSETPAAPAVQPAEAGDEEPCVCLNVEQDGELLREFINESHEHLQNIEQAVLALEDNPEDKNTLNAVFRAFHSLKGGAGFLNLTAMQSLAHELESLLDLARQQKLEVTPRVIDLILAGEDTLRRFVDGIAEQVEGRKGPDAIQVPTRALLQKVRAAAAGDMSFSAGKERTSCSDGQPEETIRSEGGAHAAAATAVKVDTQKLDGLVDLVGELVIAQSLVAQNRDLNAARSEQLTRDLAQLGRITKELQRTAMSLRMVPIRATFRKMNRLVRDLGVKVGKEVQLVTEGEETELDRTIVEEVSDPLVHLVRNCVDHGIERPELRVQRGKPVLGTVRLRAFHQGGNIVLEIRDDGGGLDREKILAKAVERGLVKPGDELSDAEVFQLILAPGFSTADKVTDVSGRGVGMDVVKRNVESLRGKLEIQSQPGEGTTFCIFLPLTLAIIDGLLVGVGDQCFILPTLMVRESFRPAPGMISTVNGRGEMVNVRGRLRPLLRLYAHLGVQPASTNPAESIVLVVEAGNDARCILVDRLLGKQEVVIKSLGETFRRSRCLAGAAILGDGRVGLILDVQALVHLDEQTLKQAA